MRIGPAKGPNFQLHGGGALALTIGSIVALATLIEDKDPNKPSPCPGTYLVGAEPLINVPDAQVKIQNATERLRIKIGAKPDSDIAKHRVPSNYLRAAEAVFNSYDQYELTIATDTRVNSIGEFVCKNEKTSELYYSPAANEAIGAMRAVGIE